MYLSESKDIAFITYYLHLWNINVMAELMFVFASCSQYITTGW